ncbi:16S rRNA-processing protein RimM [Paucilactobacillus hokkaidonensis JCM 18461]|uniref:Ribosome maturation factor RimM n=2 Tax=Paucilactobacillus hokkaidonensis TaxID=1193095 RepID=A0A0A1GUE5_9LACO|nr:ribosome maturation factor RimM [Paucilactobacillus hokkaidonensis]KRO10604.1 16S rRNA-processing protein RimM [Paucilactobacillus hokkaidonensis]BAP85595.1 16S rRNA-processing protein RimM [Paucilactobacillus hokkaidonensis JCM 18461]
MEYYNIGKIINTHGIRGEVKVLVTTDFPELRFKAGKHIWIDAHESQMIEVVIKSVRKQKQFLLITFVDLEDINLIEKYKTCDLMVTQDEQQSLPKGQYYYHEIIGLNVETEAGEQLGTISEVLAPGANDVWVVKRPQQADLLLPVIDDVVKKVDLENKRVVVELMEGL